MKKMTLVLWCLCMTSCASLPENTTAASYAQGKVLNSRLSQEIDSRRKEYGLKSSDTWMLLLDDGADALFARVSLVNAAQKSIDLQYYQYHSDLSGGILLAALWAAAERGVKVRLLVDDMGLEGKDTNIANLNAHPNFEVRIFNPFLRNKSRISQFITGVGTVTRRMHNKTFNVDGSIAILGGRNIGDQYFGAHSDVYFGDLDIAFSGDVVEEVQISFDLYWNSELSYRIDLLSDDRETRDDWDEVSASLNEFIEKNTNSKYASALKSNGLLDFVKEGKIKHFRGDATILYDDPLKIVTNRNKTEYQLIPKLRPYVLNATDELLIVSPYFVPGKEGVAFIRDIRNRGVKVKILTNSLVSNDVTIVHAGYSKYRKELLELGVELYEVDSQEVDVLQKYSSSGDYSNATKLSLHAKYFVIDRETTFIGSLNLDPRSHRENTEVGVIAYSPQMSETIAIDFIDIIKKAAFKLTLEEGDIVWSQQMDGKTVVYHEDPYSSWWDRMKNSFMQWLPVESQL